MVVGSRGKGKEREGEGGGRGKEGEREIREKERWVDRCRGSAGVDVCLGGSGLAGLGASAGMPRPGVKPTPYMPPQQQLAHAVSRYSTFCGMTGRTEEVCRKRNGTCFACGSKGHQMKDCPKNRGYVATTARDTSGTGISIVED
ncbi:hypothetical protein RJ639_025398 [Escallonia herrerae]|uniref:CCHC-type domain-containing protein n=1 Tax=Escallonia herrerae TaxID=1293975 RepID=A0AA88UXV7_9ASTE|nr:hypothetical protein RJ639_025398 [Escallonia herrerae]